MEYCPRETVRDEAIPGESDATTEDMQVDMQSNDLVTPPRTNGKALMYNVSNTEATVPTARTDIEETFATNKNTLPVCGCGVHSQSVGLCRPLIGELPVGRPATVQ